MKPWQFKQKTPGFGITKDFYVSVLSASAAMPSMLHVVNPKGDHGAVEGFGVPLAKDATKDDLSRPLLRGAYAIATKDRKTVLRLIVMSKDETGFDPTAVLRSSLATKLAPEIRDRISATWSVFQLTFESHHPSVYESVRFVLRVSQRLSQLTGGVVADPVSEVYLLPEEVFSNPQASPLIDARDVVRVHRRNTPEGEKSYTLGMRKFGLPEIEIAYRDPAGAVLCERFLQSLAQKALLGKVLELGDLLGAKPYFFQVATGGLDRGQWEGIPAFELIPPTGRSSEEVLQNWAALGGSE